MVVPKKKLKNGESSVETFELTKQFQLLHSNTHTLKKCKWFYA